MNPHFQVAEVDVNDPLTQALSQEIVATTVKTLGPGRALAVLLASVEEVLCTLMHVQTPMPEAHIESIKKMLDTLRASVLSHEECLRGVNADTRPPVVH